MSNLHRDESIPRSPKHIVRLKDEDGGELDLEMIDVIPCENAQYAVFFPEADTREDFSRRDAVILKADLDDEGNMCFKVPDSRRESEAVLDIFLSRLTS